MIWLCFYQFWVNFTHFQSNFETLNGDKVVSAGIHCRKWQWVRNRKKKPKQNAIFMIWLCIYQLWVNFNHFWSNFKMLNGNIVVSAGIHGRKWQWVRNRKKKKKNQDAIFMIWLCIYQLWVNFNHFWSNFKMLNGNIVVSAGIHGRKWQWVRNRKKNNKMPSLWSDYVFINCGSISTIFGQILKCSTVT